MIKEFYNSIGGDYNEVMLRIPNEDIIRKFVLKFKDDDSYKNGKKALEENDIKSAFLYAHTLKGIAKNLGFARLGNAASDLTEALRNATVMPSEDIISAFEREYATVMAAIDMLRLP